MDHRMSKKAGEDRGSCRGRSMQVSKGGIPSKNKTTDGKVTEGLRKSKKGKQRPIGSKNGYCSGQMALAGLR